MCIYIYIYIYIQAACTQAPSGAQRSLPAEPRARLELPAWTPAAQFLGLGWSLPIVYIYIYIYT